MYIHYVCIKDICVYVVYIQRIGIVRIRLFLSTALSFSSNLRRFSPTRYFYFHAMRFFFRVWKCLCIHDASHASIGSYKPTCDLWVFFTRYTNIYAPLKYRRRRPTCVCVFILLCSAFWLPICTIWRVS